VDLAGGRDDPASGGESPVYISAIHKVRKGEGADYTGGRDDPASGGESPVYISAIHKVRKWEGAD
jgi:hypothetical protein